MDESWREKAHIKIQEIAETMAKNVGATCDVLIKKGYPVLVNDENYTQKAIDFAQNLWGSKYIKPLEKRMTAEDFAYYSQQIPGIFYRLGTGNQQTTNSEPLHSSKFTIDEGSLKT